MSEKNLLIAAVVAAFAAAPAAAQVELSLAYEAAQAAAAARTATSAAPADAARAEAAAAPTSCDDAKELETSFEFALTPADGGNPVELKFEYKGCDWEPRNDYLPPYTTRSYEAKDGYGLTIVTNDGDAASEALLSKGKDWIGRLGSPANDALASGDPVSVELTDHENWRKNAGRATLRNAAKPLYPQLRACETADWSGTGTSAPARTDGKPAMGWEGRMGPSLVLLTKTAAYYYHEDCDICAEATKCDLATGKLTSAVVAHSVDCDDMKPFRKDAVYDACPDAR